MSNPNTQSDKFITTRSFLFANVENLLENLNQRRQAKKIESDDLFGGGDEQPMTEMKYLTQFTPQSKLEILLQEKEFLGLYLSGNPLQDYAELVSWVQDNTFRDDIHLIVINKIRKIFTKANKMMFALAISTPDQDLEAIIFPKKAIQFSPLLQEKQLFWVKGKLSQKDRKQTEKITEGGEVREYDELPKILIDEIVPFASGILPLFASEPLSLAANRQKMIEALDWTGLKHNPGMLFSADSLPKLVHKDTSSQNIKPDEAVETTVLRLGKDLGTTKLKEIKSGLLKSAQEGYLEVEIEVEGVSGWKKAKGTFWIEKSVYNQINTKS